MTTTKNYTPGRARRRCRGCGVTELSCTSMSRDTGHPCCPNCHHDIKEDD
ncbi:hypothetical protein [Brevibacterium casei]|uniref:Uncharacterized protein n=1 Tax=Brevibacterium casei TaxID=33889 RepID=A0A7T2WN99_9MICO|nr:hypothetical protein [Brevibacterium casei]QPS33432.1 hypothetical protein I6G59_16100 [Brevibacterium casei]